MDARSLGLVIVVLGGIAVVVGLLVAAGLLSWVGRLPGDVNIERGNVRIIVPVTTMLLASLLLSALFYVVRRWFG